MFLQSGGGNVPVVRQNATIEKQEKASQTWTLPPRDSHPSLAETGKISQ
jgi:hypothetical protein